MRTRILSLLVRGGVACMVMSLVTAARAQDAAPKDAAPKSVTLSESAGSSASTPVVQVKNEPPPPAPPPAAAAGATPAAAGARRPAAGTAGMTYGRYGGVASGTDS